MGEVNGFSYREWIERAKYEHDPYAANYKLRKAMAAAETSQQYEWADSLRDYADLTPDDSPLQLDHLSFEVEVSS